MDRAMLVFNCHHCKTALSAEESQAGEKVRCPKCLTTLRVPAPAIPLDEPELAGVGAPAPLVSGPASSPAPQTQRRVTVNQGFRAPGGGKRYGFNCVYCSSRLEATEAVAGQEGSCPTCGNTIVIPILDRYGRLIDPVTRQIIKQDPHPVHAYAAAGDRAPKILRQSNGGQVIQCPRCFSMSAINSNNCKSCGMPFTMEGTTLEAAGSSNGFCVTSLVMGILGLPMACTLIVPLLAIIFGAIGYAQVTRGGGEGGGKGMAIAGMICGGVGMIVFAWTILS